MNITKRTKRSYDHRIKLAIVHSGNPDLFPELSIPRSTAKNWINRGLPEIVTPEELDLEKSDLSFKLLELQNLNSKLEALLKMVLSVMKIMGFSLKNNRAPEAERKSAILSAIKAASEAVPLEECLDAIEITSQRYKNWLK